ncbi:hypothetical protein SAMN06297468_1829 [Altererythrobacter xiamenensis]|uniref:Uncharacterized protein n=1 Tax=Altererythrobacter xiamenensis TaxID=1316679 RepID=A0A1Y6FA48_9SPHN|nr:hypothetical protein SAMN06297468_1829 [Altererythrobacter xiamenensis]
MLDHMNIRHSDGPACFAVLFQIGCLATLFAWFSQ